MWLPSSAVGRRHQQGWLTFTVTRTVDSAPQRCDHNSDSPTDCDKPLAHAGQVSSGLGLREESDSDPRIRVTASAQGTRYALATSCGRRLRDSTGRVLVTASEIADAVDARRLLATAGLSVDDSGPLALGREDESPPGSGRFTVSFDSLEQLLMGVSEVYRCLALSCSE